MQNVRHHGTWEQDFPYFAADWPLWGPAAWHMVIQGLTAGNLWSKVHLSHRAVASGPRIYRCIG